VALFPFGLLLLQGLLQMGGLRFALGAAADFLLFLIFSGMGIVWLKVLTAIFAIIVPILCLVLLYLSQELLRQRSLWLTTGFGSIVVCTIVSLICNFPCP
jgi:hypothetical protein